MSEARTKRKIYTKDQTSGRFMPKTVKVGRKIPKPLW